MKNVIKIIVSDIKRLSTNVVAMVVIIGLTVIPSLYAWFNILSNWDPYGESATTNLQVAVASSDEGIMIGSVELNVGDIIISNLKENTTIGWVFTDTAQDAVNGVYSGDYYAALVIDEEFSSNMISFLSGDIENPIITYYENEKKNAIAPKITAKVKTTIEREVDHAFVSTVAESLLKGGEYFATLDEEGNITGAGINKLEQLDSDLNGMITILDSYIALMDSTESISEAGEAITDSADTITEMAGSMAEKSQGKAAGVKDDVEQSKKNVDRKVENINEKLSAVDSDVNTLNEKVAGLSLDVNVDYEQMQQSVEKIQEMWGTDQDGIYQLLLNVDAPDTEEGALAKEAITEYANVLNDLIAGLDEDVTNMQSATAKGEEDFNAAKDTLVNNVAGILACTKNIRGQYSSLSSVGQEAIDAGSKAVEEVEKLINYNATSIDLVADNLDNYAVIMEQSKDSLVKSRDEAVEMESQLAALIAEIKAIGQNEAYQKVMELLQSDPDLLSDFISSPVDISDEYIYPVENNGSMTAPFYIILSIWVGALIMSTILKTTVKDTTGMDNLKNWQCFLGRYFTTFVIGQIQTIITVLGAFLFVGIQCEHPFYFWLACAWTSLIYSLLLYSFTYSFGNVGEALSVVLMVIQVAGAGGTFPIEVLPKVFQVLYKFMPFNYSMNALRECIAGFYENTYRNCMLILIIYGVIAVFIGVTLYHPFKILNEKIESSKEKSGILI
ncbi:YhgE/Pip domain-containing protein [Pseudobutyrivibrio ruminis]|uniref:Putative membrane protein n=1 Tax=Pseudobutyrivibrio ruminis DSM 9787 TaxID=1123011 RepID=A0A285SRK2_9FIRM|nr:YhgE/Pip domain-containing protein [Pseudobutyrivibrio ruminis]SOC10777.1 putative membrane protein [Pseudobutyrivibrio ruminis DSM 9787]